MDWSLLSMLSMLVNTSKLAGWVRAGVAAGIVWVVAHYPIFSDILTPDAQTALATFASIAIVGVWSHVAKSISDHAQAQAAPGAGGKAIVHSYPLVSVLALLAALSILGGCTAAQKATFQAAVQTTIAKFNSDVAAVNAAIADIDAKLQPNCTKLVTLGQALATSAGVSTANGSGLIGVDAALASYCMSNPINIQTAYTALVAAVSAGTAAAASAKAGN